MSTPGRLISGLVTTVMALAGFAMAGTLPATAAPGMIPYVALGDSYAAGTAHGCSQSGYPDLLKDGRIESPVIAACSGWKISDVLSYVDDPQLTVLDSSTRLVTLTVGAANLALSGVLTACSRGATQDCLQKIADARLLLGDCTGGESSELDGDLSKLYGEVAAKAPRARIMVTGYPLLFESPPTGSLQAAINEATTDLNCVIERAVATANNADVNIHYVDVTDVFSGHGIVIDSTESDFIYATGLEVFHPTAKGYKAYADAISAALPSGWLKQEPLA